MNLWCEALTIVGAGGGGGGSEAAAQPAAGRKEVVGASYNYLSYFQLQAIEAKLSDDVRSVQNPA